MQLTTTEKTNEDYGRFDNFTIAKMQSEKAVNNRTVFPSGEKVRVINPNAKPFKLDPPK